MRAGKYPDIAPIINDIVRAPTSRLGFIISFRFAPPLGKENIIGSMFIIAHARPIPVINPIVPPIKLIMLASLMNNASMSFFFAPIAFSIPISLVLSITLVNIVLLIPIAPTSRLIAAIPPRNAVISVVIVFTLSCIVAKDSIVKSSSLVLCNFSSSLVIDSSTSSTRVVSVTFTLM